MILDAYLALLFAGFGFLIATLFQNKEHVLFSRIAVPVIAAILLISAGFYSLDIEETFCYNAIQNTTDVNENATTYANNFECNQQRSVEDPLTYIYGMFGVFAFIIAILRILEHFAERVKRQQ